jgi:hypothetical protein
MRSVSHPFIAYDSGGAFTLEECVFRVAEPLAQWVSESNSWNSTFLSLGNGIFIFNKTDFGNIGVTKRGSCVVSVILESGKTFTMEECEFGGGSLDDDGSTINIASSVSEDVSVIIFKSMFRSCYGEKGGVFQCEIFFFFFVWIIFLFAAFFFSTH